METINASTTHGTVGRTRQILVVVCAILLYGLVAGIRANTGLLSALISADTMFTYGDVSLAFSVMNVVLAISIPILAALTLKVQQFYLFLIGIALAAIGFFGASFATSTVTLVIFLGILFGIGASTLSFTIVYSAAKPFFGVKGSAILSGVLLAAQGAIGLAVSAIIGIATETVSIDFCLTLLAICTVCLVPFAFIYLKRKTPREQIAATEDATTEKSGPLFKKMLVSPFFYLLMFGVIAFAMGNGFLENHMAQTVVVLFDADTAAQSLVSATYTISVMAGALIGGFIAAKVKNLAFTLAIILFSWVLLNIILSAMISTYLDTGFRIPTLLGIIQFLCGFLLNCSFVLIIGLAVRHLSPRISVVVIGLCDSLGFLVCAINLFLGGVLFEIYGNFKTLYFVVYLLCATAAFLFLIHGIRERRRLQRIYF